jgi:hypothetical protein
LNNNDNNPPEYEMFYPPKYEEPCDVIGVPSGYEVMMAAVDRKV